MKARIVRIGNSRGIRLPKSLLEESKLSDDVELRAEDGRIIIESARRVRAGWSDAAQGMRAAGEDGLLDPAVPTTFDDEEWTW